MSRASSSSALARIRRIITRRKPPGTPMKLNRIASAFVAILLVAPTLFAAEDLTGEWSGTVVVSMNGGAAENESAHMTLKHTGKELTGMAGPSVDRQWPILKGTVVVSGTAPKESTKVSFDVQDHGTTGPMLHFELELIDGHLKGTAKAEQDGMTMNAVVDVTRVK